MCGIVGYNGDRKASEIVYRGLKKLEYRGYDSAGIATAGNPTVKVEKGEGTIDDVSPEKKDGTSGVGHTRWATHGGVNDTNAHPHRDCTGDIAVVHNGIINNYEELKEKLENRGHEFKSETDTEVIPHLLEEQLEDEKPLHEAAQNVADTIEGSYAVVAVLDTGELVAFKNESPLALGVADEEFFLASDVTPFLEHTDEAIFLEDGEVITLNGDYQIFQNGEEVDREPRKVDWDAEEACKEGHEHFMEKEIKEQPQTVKKAAFQDETDMKEAVKMVEDAETVYLTGCGTASFAASLGAKYLREADVEVVTEQSHELEYRTDEINEDDLVIAVSQSGETADLLSTLDDSPAPTLAVVNVVGSTLARQSEHTLFVNAGPEIGVASTKAFTAQIAVLKLVQYALQDELEEGRRSILETAEKLDEVLRKNEGLMDDISSYLQEKNHVFTIGRDKGHEMAQEAALKLKELSYIHVEGFPGGEFKHGNLALIEEGVPVISFLKDTGYEDAISNTLEAKSRGADIIGVGSEPVDKFRFFIEIPKDPNSEILEIVPFQMIAYLTSVKKGNDPDKPRNLAKSVTVK
ncbi:glutamine--fructose-6-phosphate transaminase (isomerizing) [Candidatus Nanohalobium constans]|uniref:Glutamine--fructose-6-phosphate aminotransferase [isomerizing] n=1 Tax=Candidatus Nanohalobium constans TaxID=2565781 RepID=A0A5Q0UI23_9ARCH|nr:glutamine--fructose-6-phosphate transaminase (isomerizing) [Candidatus Nanohalobium constans]QGA80529.1 glucosamine--fructose-6-phosphate aminotransferase [Candidatus Nanohalobium constans]